MRANDFKTYRGFNSQDFMLTGSQYNALRRNLNSQKPSKPVRGTDDVLKYATMKRDAQLGRISDEEAEAFRKKKMKSANAKKRVFISQAKKLSEEMQKEKVKQIETANKRTAAYSNRSIMQFINVQIDKLLSRIDSKTARVTPDLQIGVAKMKDQIQKAVDEFIDECYMPFMTGRLHVMTLLYEKEVVAAVEECCDIIGDQLSEFEATQIMAQCYRELADGRLKPNRINYFIASRWETACNYKIAHNQI